MLSQCTEYKTMAPYFGLAKPNYVYLQTHLTRLQPYACEISRNERKKFWYKKS